MNAPQASQTKLSSLELQRQSIQKQRESLAKQNRAMLSGSLDNSGSFVLPWPPAFASTETNCTPLPSGDVDALVTSAAQKESISPKLIRAVMKQESGFKPCAVSPKGAQGLMQIMPAVAEQFHVANPFDPAQNVQAGTALLKQLMGKYNGDLKLVLGAYNAGGSRVDAVGDVPNIAETRNYVDSILSEVGQDFPKPVPADNSVLPSGTASPRD